MKEKVGAAHPRSRAMTLGKTQRGPVATGPLAAPILVRQPVQQITETGPDITRGSRRIRDALFTGQTTRNVLPFTSAGAGDGCHDD
jgi:hypothetical protein